MGVAFCRCTNMRALLTIVAVSTVLLVAAKPPRGGASAPKLPKDVVAEGPPVLWREPADIASRDVYYGPGGKSHEPQTELTFLSEDTRAASPKFEAVDEEGIHWKVKLGI